MKADDFLRKARELMTLAEKMAPGEERDRMIREAEEMSRRAHSAGWLDSNLRPPD